MAVTLKECANLRVLHARFSSNDYHSDSEADRAAAAGNRLDWDQFPVICCVRKRAPNPTEGRRGDFKNALGFAQLVSRQNIASSLERKTNGSKKVNNSSLLPAIATRPGRGWHSS